MMAYPCFSPSARLARTRRVGSDIEDAITFYVVSYNVIDAAVNGFAGCSIPYEAAVLVSSVIAMPTLLEQFGNIDIYLFDQILRGRIAAGMRVLDAGCGSGRNLIYLLRSGYEVFGADADPQAVDETRRLAASLAPALPG